MHKETLKCGHNVQTHTQSEHTHLMCLYRIKTHLVSVKVSITNEKQPQDKIQKTKTVQSTKTNMAAVSPLPPLYRDEDTDECRHRWVQVDPPASTVDRARSVHVHPVLLQSLMH